MQSNALINFDRIKGILDKGREVELSLLGGMDMQLPIFWSLILVVAGVQESVELLSSVACLDPDQVSPVCLEIGALCRILSLHSTLILSSYLAQLCGRLPVL